MRPEMGLMDSNELGAIQVCSRTLELCLVFFGEGGHPPPPPVAMEIISEHTRRHASREIADTVLSEVVEEPLPQHNAQQCTHPCL